ncbi:GerAB/ArcD/ProY family transporter [Neobacillus mesonae]|uniref:GerAB/ArcD/ProY family transporter n=1 Tax=Neobacillus mesonae TaxID=1193713 RepID=UPI00203A77F8|nr:GerAB/ArcD/ProY family transporter [Neobacillus mesonae]MCM3566973.1 spore germination protein [Neobacillus mesonae]
METAKISGKQLFVLVVLFEMGTALLEGFPVQLKQDAWIAILAGMAGGVLLFLVYYRLFLYYPDLPLTGYVEKIIGKWPGRVIGFIYIIYFAYLAARGLRDFGELLTATIYTNTPIFFLMSILILTITYAIQKGFEVLARVGEIFFAAVYMMAVIGFFLIIFSGLIHLENLKPVLESGWRQIMEVSIRQTMPFPFGEMILFTMILPHLNDQKKAKMICISGIVLSGINITIACIINIATLGTDLFLRSQYPLLSTVSKIQLFNFIERLDVLFMIYVMVAGFIKVAIFYYAAVAGTTGLFKFKNHRQVTFPMGILILVTAMMIASNFAEHIKEGLYIIPVYMHWPLQIYFPCLLLGIAMIRNRKKQKKAPAA